MNKRKVCACLLLAVLFITAFGTNWIPVNKVEAAQTTVILHYQRDDGNYRWNKEFPEPSRAGNLAQ